MSKYKVPTEQQAEILQRNGLDPDKYVVSFADENMICLLCHKTRDTITIYRGDKKW